VIAWPSVGVLSIQGDVREHMRSLDEVGAAPSAVKHAYEFSALDALIIPGGESTTMSKRALAEGLMGPLRDFRASGRPIYGSCAGMIMLADAVLDGRPDQETVGGIDMVVRRNAFGRQVDSFEAQLPMPAFGREPVHAVFIRAPWVESIGEDVEVLGTVHSESGADRIVAVRQNNLLATSFHPELTGDTRVHQYFVSMVRRDS